MLRAATTLGAALAGTAIRGLGGALTHGRPERATLLAFIGAVVVGGGNFVAVRFSNEKLPPLFGAPLRFGAAAVILFRIARVRGVPLPRGRAASGAALYGLLGFGLAYAFISTSRSRCCTARSGSPGAASWAGCWRSGGLRTSLCR